MNKITITIFIIIFMLSLYLLGHFSKVVFEHFGFDQPANSLSWQNDVFMLRGYLFPFINSLQHDRQSWAPSLDLQAGRVQITTWVDSWMKLMAEKYPPDSVARNMKYEGVTWSPGPNDSLLIQNTVAGNSSVLQI